MLLPGRLAESGNAPADRQAIAPLAVAGGTESDAVTLFVDRAHAVRPAFGLGDGDTAAAVTEICTTLDGLPLGIELAAARMAAMSAIEVRDRLADRFRLLQGSTPGHERQHTLRHAVAWSYDLLTDDERELLRATSVFAGGFELASIHAVAPGSDVVDVLRNLDSLVRKSLVVADHTTTRTRYTLFETIRRFAEDQLEAGGELAATRDRHAAYFAGEASDRWDRWNGPGWREAVDWVEAELGDRLASRLGTTRAGELVASGADLDLDAAAGYAREQINAARRDPGPRPRGVRPGGLSSREIDVLRLVAAGRTSGEIARELFISPRTAEHHVQNIYTKISVSNRAAATRWAVTHRVVDGVQDS